MIQAHDPAAESMNGPLAMVLLLAIAIAVPLSLALLALYRRAVKKSMARRGGQTPKETPLPPLVAANIPPLPKPVDASTSGPESRATGLQAAVLRAPWLTAAVYLVAGVSFAMVESVFFLLANEVGFGPVRLLALFWCFFWPSVLTVNLVAGSTRFTKTAVLVFYFLVLVGVSVVAYANSPEGSLFGVPITWLMFNLPASLLLLTFLNRRVRAVGPLVLIFMLVAVLGVQLMLSVLTISDDIIRGLVVVFDSIGLGAFSILLVLTVLGFFGGWPIGWLILWLVRRRYERKRVSDQSINIDTIFLLFAVTNSFLLASQGTIWLFSALVCFLAFKVVASLGFFFLRAIGPSDREPLKLLVLRVFSLGKPSEKLFAALAKHWRQVGSMQLIAGPDLATSTIEPHEFLDFVTGKLARRFIDGPERLKTKIDQMDTKPDKDGRFRVNDFFCHDDTWKLVLTRLVEDSRVVIMDLRGFTADNEGCLYEISELVNLAPLRKVVFVIETPADEQLLTAQLKKSWTMMRPTSPNLSAPPGEVNLFRFTGEGNLPQLLRSLCNAASSA